MLVIISNSSCLIRTVATTNADLSRIYLERARLYYERDNAEKAIEECEKTLSIQPDTEETR